MCKDNYYCLFWFISMIPAFGKYMTMLYSIFLKPEKFSIYWKRFVDEVIQLGLKSLFIVILMSGFMGAVLVIQTASVISNAASGKNASLVNGILRLTYHESILQDSIKAYIVFSDVGNAIDGKSVVEGLPLIGTEDFKLVFEDNNDKKIKVDMVVN